MLATQVTALLARRPAGRGRGARASLTASTTRWRRGFGRLGDGQAAALAALAGALAGDAARRPGRRGGRQGRRRFDRRGAPRRPGRRPDRAARRRPRRPARPARRRARAGPASPVAGAAGRRRPRRPEPARRGAGPGCASWRSPAGGASTTTCISAVEPVVAGAAAPSRRCAGSAVLLDGLAAELRACVPGRHHGRGAGPPLGRPVGPRAAAVPARPAWRAGGASRSSGRLLPLGVDVHEHGTAVQVQVHAVLEPADGAPARLVRTSVVGAARWTPSSARRSGGCCTAHPLLLTALAEQRARGAHRHAAAARRRPGLARRAGAARRARRPVRHRPGAARPARSPPRSPPLDRHPVAHRRAGAASRATPPRDDDGT